MGQFELAPNSIAELFRPQRRVRGRHVRGSAAADRVCAIGACAHRPAAACAVLGPRDAHQLSPFLLLRAATRARRSWCCTRPHLSSFLSSARKRKLRPSAAQGQIPRSGSEFDTCCRVGSAVECFFPPTEGDRWNPPKSSQTRPLLTLSRGDNTPPLLQAHSHKGQGINTNTSPHTRAPSEWNRGASCAATSPSQSSSPTSCASACRVRMLFRNWGNGLVEHRVDVFANFDESVERSPKRVVCVAFLCLNPQVHLGLLRVRHAVATELHVGAGQTKGVAE